VQLVQQLLLAGLETHASAGAFELADYRRAIPADLGERKAQPREVRHILVGRIREVATGDLPGAFQEVPDHGAPAQPLPIIPSPAEFVHKGRKEQRRIAHPSGDDEVRPICQRRDDRLRAEIRVGRDHPLRDVADAALRFDQRQVAISHRRHHVVTTDGRDLEALDPHLAGDARRGAGGADRIGRAHIGDDLYFIGDAGAEHHLETLAQQWIEARIRLPLPHLLRQRDRALRQALEHEIVEAPALGKIDRGLDAIAGVPGARADPERSHL
jgi:hypothetical protein